MAYLLLGRKELEVMFVVLAAALLLLVAKANSQCPQGQPLFGDREPHNELPDKIQAILPTYIFTCSGPVVQWGACVQPRGGAERYDIYFQVWRLTGEDGCYSIVGSNFIADGDPETPRGCIIFDVPEGQRIMVEAGDVMGFYSDHNKNKGGVEVDTAVNLDVWYRTLPNPTVGDLEGSTLCVGSTGDLNTVSDSGAPVITAVVDNSQCLSKAPLFGDRDGPEVPSLPNSIQTIIPAYTFTCRGSVVQWGVCVNPREGDDDDEGDDSESEDSQSDDGDGDGYDIYFEVWRPMDTNGCYTLVGSNFVNNGVPGEDVHNVRSCIVIDVPEDELVIVEPGDVVGFSSNGNGGVELDEGVQYANLEVWYRSNPSQEDNSLCVGVDEDLATQRTGGAPVITAVIAADCGSLTDPANGSVSLTMTTFGSMASYSCSERNNLSGDAVRTCRANGMWSDSAPMCVVNCGNLQDPENGIVTVTETTFGSTASYSCSGSNYLLVGAAERTCQADGMWSGSAPECVLDCGILPNPENGMVTVTETTFGSIASYSCSGSNYLLVGAAERTCQADGMWSGSAPICVIDCGSLQDPENGMVSVTETTFGSTASYSCSGSNYLLVGAAERTCQADGMWSGSAPICVIDCGSLQDPENGMVSVTETTFGSTASYSCSGSNYLLVGAAERTCQADGMWSGSAPICVIDCGSLQDPENGMVSVTETTFGSTASYSCSGSNYLLVGAVERTCQVDGMWSGSAPECVVDCGILPNPANGTVSVTGTTFGSTASYSCSGSRYLLVGNTTRMCQANREWSGGAPACEEVCDALTNPMNGEIIFSNGTFVGSVATYSCTMGTESVGSETRTCQSGSGWSGMEPSCEHLLSTPEQSQSQSARGPGPVIGGVVAGVVALVVVALAVPVALAILYKKRKGSFTLRSKMKSRDRTHIQQFGYGVENPLYSGMLTQPNYSSLSDTGEAVYENPDHQRLENDYEDPDKVDIYRTMSNVPLIERGHRTLLDTNGQYEWGIYVPTQEQRRAVTSSKEQHENIYAALGEVQKPQGSFFEVHSIYWKPSSDPNKLYDQLSMNKYREIPRKLIQTTEHLGSGQFGSVQRGIWQTKTGAVEIAVKTLKAGVSQSDEVRFLQEAAINGQFQHPNIVKLLGVVTVGQPVMIVLELLSNGDLRNYLIRHQPVPGELLPSDTPHMLLQFCQEVASGMEYLSQKAFVHRDLAARNILVAADRTCKISDFGMSRDLENETYYVSQGGKIPVKWTAPEALHFKKYSTASDVWSYGALVYEIWSVGRKPFQSYTNQEAMKLVDSGVRLPPSPGCPKEIYKVMIRCWHPDTSSRPSFTEVVEALSEPEIDLLCWSEEDTVVHPQAAVLGAPLEAGLDLYPELQGTYT